MNSLTSETRVKTGIFPKTRVDMPPRLAHIPRPSEVRKGLCLSIFQAKHMVSYTAKTTTRREIRAKSAGRKTRIARNKEGTPSFPIHPEGYDPKAADAKPVPTAKPASAEASK